MEANGYCPKLTAVHGIRPSVLPEVTARILVLNTASRFMMIKPLHNTAVATRFIDGNDKEHVSSQVHVQPADVSYVRLNSRAMS